MKPLEQSISRCLKNDRKAQYQLFQQFQPFLKMLCRQYLYDKEILEDINQEVWLKIFKHLKSYDPAKSSFKTWISNITIRRIYDCNKVTANNAKIVELDTSHYSKSSTDEFEQAEYLMRLIDSLERRQAEVFKLHVIQGFSHEEIAELLEISNALSRKTLSRAKIALQKEIKRLDVHHIPNNI